MSWLGFLSLVSQLLTPCYSLNFVWDYHLTHQNLLATIIPQHRPGVAVTLYIFRTDEFVGLKHFSYNILIHLSLFLIPGLFDLSAKFFFNLTVIIKLCVMWGELVYDCMFPLAVFNYWVDHGIKWFLLHGRLTYIDWF